MLDGVLAMLYDLRKDTHIPLRTRGDSRCLWLQGNIVGKEVRHNWC
jgi:hypothetical protein